MTGPETARLAPLLDVLCPMHLVLSGSGHVVHAGPTAQKVLDEKCLLGRRFFELFEVKRPRRAASMAALRAAGGQRLHCVLRGPAATELKGVAVPLPSGEGPAGQAGGVIVNLSFGIGVMEAVGQHDLTSSDFAATDLAVEMLYLLEAKSAVMEAWRKLNLRLQGAKAAAEEEAFTDTLTGLRNRRALEPMLNRLIETGEDFALMHLDLDFFKMVNDTLGHAAGDHVLRQVAKILRSETRGDDAIMRVGGDEFVLIFAPRIPREKVAIIAARLIRRLEEPIPYNDKVARISASIGTTLSELYDSPAIGRMMEDADLALYAAKDAGRACHVAFHEGLRATSRASGPAPVARRDEMPDQMPGAVPGTVPER